MRVNLLFPGGMGLAALSLTALSLVALTACQPSSPVSQDPAPVTSQVEGSVSQAAGVVKHQDLLRSLPSWQTQTRVGIAYTSPQDRLEQVQVGRRDPFAPTETIVVTVEPDGTKDGAPLAAPITAPIAAPLTAPMPLTPPQAMPNSAPPSALPPVTVSAVAAPLPGEPPPGLEPALSPTHLADHIQVKGVVEFNQQWQAIVWEPQTSSSKTVRAGDVLGNGQVTVRRIEQTGNGLLRIVLEQNGIEVIHTVS